MCLDAIDCGTEPLNVSNPENCTAYFHCIGTSLYPRACEPGLHFHQNGLKCYDSNPSCQQRCLGETSYKDHIVFETAPVTASEATTARDRRSSVLRSEPTSQGTSAGSTQSTTLAMITDRKLAPTTAASSGSNQSSLKPVDVLEVTSSSSSHVTLPASSSSSSSSPVVSIATAASQLITNASQHLSSTSASSVAMETTPKFEKMTSSTGDNGTTFTPSVTRPSVTDQRQTTWTMTSHELRQSTTGKITHLLYR